MSHKGKRTCIACRCRKDKGSLIPLYKLDGSLHANLNVNHRKYLSKTKGLYICPQKKCFFKASKILNCNYDLHVFFEDALNIITERIIKTMECGGPGSGLVAEKLEILSSKLVAVIGSELVNKAHT
jgi:predicted RNA-binding protein YlxR (DUF448 family)